MAYTAFSIRTRKPLTDAVKIELGDKIAAVVEDYMDLTNGSCYSAIRLVAPYTYKGRIHSLISYNIITPNSLSDKQIVEIQKVLGA